MGMHEHAIHEEGLAAMKLPSLREDLRLYPGPRQSDGSPSWTLHDPIRNRFFRIGWPEFEILAVWSSNPCQTMRGVLGMIEKKTTLRLTPSDGQGVLAFCLENSLCASSSEMARKTLERKIAKGKKMVPLVLQHYLFFRVPLWRPDRFLEATLPWARLGMHPLAIGLFVFLGIAAFLLVCRQWESFLATFPYFFTPMGLAFCGIAVFVTKAAHELGHAYAAKHLGLLVPTMGIAFLVLWPVLYTDATESWKLARRRDRLVIAGAGGLAELSLAALAAFSWSFLPAGLPRSIAFLTAAVTWLHSVLLNLNPLMRYDGYYILSDLLDIPNLAERAFAHTRWRLRRLVLGMDDPPPETDTARTRRWLLAYGLAAILYRIIVFTAIALAVYHYFFKTVGIVLFAVEIVYFLVMPVVREVRYIWCHRARVGASRPHVLASLCVLGTLFFFLFSLKAERITAGAVIKAETYHRLYPPSAARLEKVHVMNGAEVRAGDLLFTLRLPQLDALENKTRAKLAGLELLMGRWFAGSELFAPKQILEERIAALLGELDGIGRERDRLFIRAPVAGEIFDLAPGLHPGRWLHAALKLGIIADTSSSVIEGYIREEDLGKVKQGDRASFHTDADPRTAIPCVVETIDTASSPAVQELLLASVYGGPLAVRERAGVLFSEESVYRVRLKPKDNAGSPAMIMRGTAVIFGKKHRPISWPWRRVLSVLIRESGF